MTTRIEVKKYGLLIDGEWRQPKSGENAERRSPADQSLVAVLPLAGESDLDLAVAAARRAFDAGPWSANVTRRARILREAATRIRAEQEALVLLLSREVGKTLSEARGEVLSMANTFDAYAGLGESANGRAIGNATSSAMGMILKEPVGVAGLIIPWNWPLIILGWKLGAVLAAGCTTVIKPSIYTGATTYEVARIFSEAGTPPGVINVITGKSGVIGDKFVTHAGIDKISFTGSTATGRHIMTLAAGDIKRISLELGGKSPNIVFADANIDAAAAGAVSAVFLNAGQTCQAGTRLLLQRSVYDEFMAKFLAFVDRIKVGDPLDPSTNMGPLVSEEQLNIVLDYVEVGKREGARLLRGGNRLSGASYDGGFYMGPTVFDAVDNHMRIAQEEIFGPVVAVIPFDDEDEALAIANDTVYGLAAGVWSSNLRTVMRFARDLKAGTVWVNCYNGCGVANVPFGGYKQSGLGREQGPEGVEAFLETKSVHINHG
ncbi:MAG: aldehyde dehydrogenase family protein [Dehalococcoidia bacterium]